MDSLCLDVKNSGRVLIDLRPINLAESRLFEISTVTPVTANELCSFFNQTIYYATNQIGLIQWEINKAQKQYDLSKATVILDKLPEAAAKLKESGQKANDQWRDAMITRDEECTYWKDIIDQLQAFEKLLQAKHKAFERAYFLAYKEKENRVTNRVMSTTVVGGEFKPLV